MMSLGILLEVKMLNLFMGVFLKALQCWILLDLVINKCVVIKCTTKYFPGAAPTSLVRSSSEHSTPIVVGQSTLESSCWPSMLPGIFLTEGWDLFNPLNSSGTAEEKLTWAFKMYDIDGNGQIDFNDHVEVLLSEPACIALRMLHSYFLGA